MRREEVDSSDPPEQSWGEDARSFEALFDRFYPAVLALFRRHGFADGDCEDLAQETFLKAHRGLMDYRGEAPIEHWLFRIASNTAKASRRFRAATRRAAVVVPLEEAALRHFVEEDASENPLRSMMASERSERLLAAVHRLPAKMRRCVLLFLQQDLLYREIGEVLQISEQTVKVQFLRARNTLRRLLREEPEIRGKRERVR